MTEAVYYRLSSLSVLEISGADAVTIANNLTTNAVASLQQCQGCESFVTDVKGKTLGHLSVFRIDDRLRMIGPAGQSEQVVPHFQKYTIIEDAEIESFDARFCPLVVTPEAAALLAPERSAGRAVWELSELQVSAYSVAWLGTGSLVLLAPAERGDQVQQMLGELMCTAAGGEDAFHEARTLAGFPWYGIDFSDKNLPQEVGRDEEAISFTKGCYLGQETVARLDAMGQVQKKLVRWKVTGAIPATNTQVTAAEKTVGRLTSIARTAENEAVAIGIARRSHFDAGSVAEGQAESGSFTARVQ